MYQLCTLNVANVCSLLAITNPFAEDSGFQMALHLGKVWLGWQHG